MLTVHIYRHYIHCTIPVYYCLFSNDMYFDIYLVNAKTSFFFHLTLSRDSKVSWQRFDHQYKTVKMFCSVLLNLV